MILQYIMIYCVCSPFSVGAFAPTLSACGCMCTQMHLNSVDTGSVDISSEKSHGVHMDTTFSERTYLTLMGTYLTLSADVTELYSPRWSAYNGVALQRTPFTTYPPL